MYTAEHKTVCYIQGGSNMTGTDLCVNIYKSVPVIFEPPCIMHIETISPSESSHIPGKKLNIS